MFNNKPSISFVSNINGLVDIESIRPRMYAQMLPQWWGETKKVKPVTPSSRHEMNVKDCPALPHFFSQAYVLPMWCDTEITVTKDNINIFSSDPQFNWEFHSSNQFMDLAPQNVRDKYSVVAKAISPWDLITSPGYSVYQMSPFYHFNDNFTILPGTIATDINPVLNLQLLISKEEKTFIIERGEPLAIYIPYKREKIDFDVRYSTQEDIRKVEAGLLNVRTKFRGGYKENFRRNK